jgi:hypothetical protein
VFHDSWDLFGSCWRLEVAGRARMWSNRTATNLQKTYDESYLRCSTAVYYESQVCVSWYGPRGLRCGQA